METRHGYLSVGMFRQTKPQSGLDTLHNRHAHRRPYPTLEVLCPSRPNGAAILIAAGGGYKRINMATEAMPAARWLIAHGITAQSNVQRGGRGAKHSRPHDQRVG